MLTYYSKMSKFTKLTIKSHVEKQTLPVFETIFNRQRQF